MNKKIKNISLIEKNLIVLPTDMSMASSNFALIVFDDLSGIMIYELYNSCCEYRYLATDDDFSDFIGSVFYKIEFKNCEEKHDTDCGVTEISFIDISTSNGSFLLKSYNEHNGYYGGFSTEITYVDKDLITNFSLNKLIS